MVNCEPWLLKEALPWVTVPPKGLAWTKGAGRPHANSGAA